MQDLREIIARNIVELRTSRGLTQNNLAEMLNYSDKAVSKWERGESVPDVAVLKAIADIFSVTVDYLITEDHTCLPDAPVVLPEGERRNRFIVSALATMLVWFIATLDRLWLLEVSDILATCIDCEVTNLVANLRKEHWVRLRERRVAHSLIHIAIELRKSHRTIELRCNVEYPTAHGILDVDKTLIA